MTTKKPSERTFDALGVKAKRWYLRAGDIARAGPFPTYERALNAARLASDAKSGSTPRTSVTGEFYDNTFIWYEWES